MSLIGRGLIREGTGKRYRRMKIVFSIRFWGNTNIYGSVVKRLRHRPFTAVTRVRFPSESLIGILAQLGEHLPYKQRVTGSSPVGPIFNSILRIINTPMWLNWQSSWFVISRLSVRVRSSAFMDGFPSGQRGQTVNLLQIASVVRIHLHPLNK